MARMRILTANEQAAFDQPPLFDHRARKQFFDLPKRLIDIATTLRTPSGQIGFLLMCGYFKATKRFYQPQDFHVRDIEAAAKVIGLEVTDFSYDTYAKQTRARHQQLILNFYGFVPFNGKAKKILAVEISAMAQMHLKPRLIFDRCVDFLVQNRIQVPTSRNLTDSNNHCNMLTAFEHWQQTHARQVTLHPALLAGIMGLGCGIGVRKMARISSQVTESELDHTVNWRFSLENIRAANGAVVKAMDTMELPNLYRQSQDQLHTSSDGQKFEVRGDSLHASRSFKYFGQGQGISAYTFVDELNFLWHSLMISAADRESAYVMDGLMHNDVVKSDIHSTDTHGYTEAVFGLTHLLGFSFAPRIKGVGKQTLYIFKPKRQMRADWSIQPDKTINETVIRENWDELLRLVTTIQLKENTASDIFRRLNSYSRQHALYQTLKAFGQIIKSLFILRYIDDLALRQAIEKQLNKIELANRFTRAVAVGSPREFIQTEKSEQEIAEACNRLIKNSIICWNYLYLTRQIEKSPNAGAKENLLRLIAIHSPMSWAHINMLGEYVFSEEKLRDTLGILPPKKAA